MKYKVGDKVRIKSLDWYNENKDEYGVVLLENGQYLFFENDTIWCGKIITIVDVCLDEYYTIVEDHGTHRWTDDMIEGLVEEKISYGIESEWLKHEMLLPEGYIFKDENGNVINATKIVLEKKKKEYPKTYEECVGKLSINWDGKVEGYKCDLLTTFQKLLICRDIYWKIAGEEMGLEKPWEPDWTIYEHKFCLGTDKGKVIEKCVTTGNRILAFPTAEMRDSFYENFKELIELCKELL
jgi:hypothetical protein